MNILSVDWDYWFPNTINFDWGHRESMFFIETIWSMRAGCRDIITGDWALDVMKPRKQYKRFWDNYVDGSPEYLVVAESHLSILEMLRSRRRNSMVEDEHVTIWNFDAHHDLGYGMTEENCGNWAMKAHAEGLMDEYKLVYPQWRFVGPECAEIPVPEGLQFEYFYEPPEIDGVDMVFICRSGSWTPTWCDAAWMKFIGYFKQFPWTWESKGYTELALRKRKPNLKEAKELRGEHSAMLEKAGMTV